MKKAITALSLTTLLLSSGISSATELSYDHVELKRLNKPAADLTGFDLYLNKSVSDNVYLLFDYAILSTEKADFSGFSFGAGYHTPINYKTDLYAEIEFAKIKGEFKHVDHSINQDGFNYKVGVRSKLTNKVEGRVFVNYADSDTEAKINARVTNISNTNTRIDIQLAFELTRNIQIIGGIDLEDERTSNIGLRFNF